MDGPMTRDHRPKSFACLLGPWSFVLGHRQIGGPLMTVTEMSRQEILDVSHDTTLYEWTVQSAMKPMVIDRAEGIYMWDADGKRYMDFNSQLMCTNIGHADERVI